MHSNTKITNTYRLLLLLLVTAVFFSVALTRAASTATGTIDSIYRYAWGENVGWVDFGDDADPVIVTDSGLFGSAYGENIGWIVLDPDGYDGVQNDGSGNLSGYAWGENIGWIDFSQVSIGSDGVFAGQAYGENIGWIMFGTEENKVLVNWAGSSTIANHDASQVNNAFSFQNKTNEPLFAFRLTPESSNATVTELTIALSGAKNINTSDFTSLTLYRDLDNDAEYDAADIQVGGAGVMTLTGDDRLRDGTITFSEDFLATTTQNYVLIGSWNAPENGAFLTLDLYPSSVSAIDDNGTQEIFGEVDDIQHNRNNQGGSISRSIDNQIAPAVAPRATTTGGGPTGGEEIGGDPDFRWPTATAGEWSNGANAYDGQNGTYATTDTDTASSTFYDYHLPISGNTIGGVTVQLEIAAFPAGGTIDVQLSWDGGSTWTSVKTTSALTASDTIVTLGSNSDKWGRSAWSAADFSDTNFRVRLTANTSSNTIYVDAIKVKVYSFNSGGAAGGGVDI
jgi:hypothetical protein